MRTLAYSVFAAVVLAFVTVAPAVSLQVSIGIRETGTTEPIGANGGATGGIEWIHLDGQTLSLDGTFQTFTFNFGTDPVNAFAGATANGVLDGTRGTLEHIRFRNIDGTMEPIQLFVDNIRNTTPLGTFTVSDFEPFPTGSRVTFQSPRFSGSTQFSSFSRASTSRTRPRRWPARGCDRMRLSSRSTRPRRRAGSGLRRSTRSTARTRPSTSRPAIC